MPNYFDLKVGFTCNNRCVHCVIDAKRATPDYTTQQIREIIDSVPSGDIVGFTGGEASIRKDFVELCRYAKETGHMTALQSNGVRFSDRAFVEEIKPYLDNVLIAIHSHDASIHDAIVMQQGMHKRTIAGFFNLLEAGIALSTQTVISTLNMTTLPDTYSWIQQHAPGTWMSMTYPHPNGAAWYNRDIVCPTYSDLHPYLQKSLQLWAPLLRTEAIPLCYIYPYQDVLGFNFDDDILRPLTDAQHSGIDPSHRGLLENEIFGSDGRVYDYKQADLSERVKGPLCSQCTFNSVCPGVWKEYLLMFKDKLDLFPIYEAPPYAGNAKENRFEVAIETQAQQCCEPPEPSDTHELLPRGAIIISSNVQCPNSCVFCAGDPVNIPSDELRVNSLQTAQWFIEHGYTRIEISGADPIEEPCTLEVLRYLSSNGIRDIQLSSHGRLLSDMRIAQQYAQAGVTSVRFPLYGSTAEMHNVIAQRYDLQDPLPFQETVAALKNCHSLGLQIVPQTIISQSNKDHLVEIFNLYEQIAQGNRSEFILGLGYIGEKTYEFTNSWYVPIKDTKPYVQHVLDTFDDIVVMDIPYCVLGHYDSRLSNPPLEILATSMGNQTVAPNYQSKKSSSIPHYREKEYWHECLRCCEREYCGGYIRNDMEMFGTYNIRAVQQRED